MTLTTTPPAPVVYRAFLLAAALLPVLAACTPAAPQAAAPPPQPPTELIFSGYGGDYSDVMKKSIIGPFEKKFNAKVVYDESGSSTEKLAKMRASKDAFLYDFAVLTDYDAAAGSRDGLLEKVSEQQVPNAARLYPELKGITGDAGPVVAIDVLTLVYNKNKVNPAPDSWTALWDPKYKGKVAVSHVSETKGLYLLLLSAFMNGGSDKNVDPGFQKIKELVPNVGAWLTLSPQYVPYLQREEVWLTPYWNGRAQYMINDGLPIATVLPKEGTIPVANAFVVPRTAKNKDLAYKFVNYFLEPEVQTTWAEQIFYGPANQDTKVSEAVARRIPYGTEQIRGLKFPDQATLQKNKSDWVERWNKDIQDAQRYAK
jgi:putative spermidine/putrescine transport system substrate-binding protein